MKKIFAIILALSLFASFAFITSAHTNSRNWYISRKNGGTPSFPDDSTFISEHNGLYLDLEANRCGEKKIYLTFDAGYENGNIEKILNTLKEEDVKGSFFILSNLIIKNTELVKRMANDGHLICNHTKNHKDMTKLTEQEVIANLASLESLYTEKTGLTMSKYFRFPEGRYNEQTLLSLEKAGYTTVFWSMAYADWDENKQPTLDEAREKLIKNVHPGAIILLHPTSTTNANILSALIKEWKEQGYTFGTLDEI